MVPEKIFIRTQSSFFEFQDIFNFDRKVPYKPALCAGQGAQYFNDIALPGSPGVPAPS
jgi:hypothetical protein